MPLIEKIPALITRHNKMKLLVIKKHTLDCIFQNKTENYIKDDLPSLRACPRIETVARWEAILSQIFRSFEANNELFNENERGIWPKWLFRTSSPSHLY